MFITRRHLVLWIAACLSTAIAPAAPLSAADFTWEDAPASTNWDNPNNWAGPNLQIPDDNSDTALVDNFIGLMPTLTANRTLGALTILNAGVVATGSGSDNFSLLIQDNGGASGTVTIDGLSSQFNAILEVRQSAAAIDLDTDQLVINDFGVLRIRDNAFVQVDQSFRTANHTTGSGNGAIRGDGTLQFAADSFNDGTLRTNPGGVFTVQSTGGANLDLDGLGGDGQLVTDSNSMLVIDAPLSDTLYNGYISMFANSEVRINQAWSLAADGAIQFDGGSTGNPGTATLSGGNANLGGFVFVNSGTAVLASPQTIITDTAAVTLADGTSVQFDALTHVENPDVIDNSVGTTFIVNHEIIIGGLVAGATVGHFDWDGEAQNGIVGGETIVNPGATLYLNVLSLDAQGLDERYSGRITLNSGRIEVQNFDGQWEMDGVLTLRNTSNQIPNLSGHTGTQVLITGDVVVEGNGATRISERSIFGSAVHVDVAAGASLQIGADQAVNQNGTSTVINGGTWTGGGAVNLDADLATIASATVVNMPNGTFDVDGDYTGNSTNDIVVLNAPLTLHVNSVDDNDANEIDDALVINGNGRLDVRLTNPNQAYSIAGTLDLNALGGGFSSSHLAGSDVVLHGTTTVAGNSIVQARVELAGYLDIAANSTFNLNAGSMEAPNIVRDGATFGGSGDLVVGAAGHLNAEDGALIGVDLVNRGRFEPGLSIGSVNITGDFSQTSSGTFGFEIAGLPGGAQDLLTVSGTASVDGVLEARLLNNFVPAEGSTYTVISAGTRLGTFDALTTPSDNIVQFNAIVLYSAGLVRLRITDVSIFGDFNDDLALDCADVDALVAEIASGGMGPLFDLTGDNLVNLDDLNSWLDEAGTFNVGGPYLPGDASLDGFVDGSDFGIWNSHKFTSNNGWCGGDFNADGFTDGSDFGIWNSHKFTSSNPFSAVIVPEPGMALGTLLILLTICFRVK